ncbi:MAG TPA: VWA domain-containing protein [Solirubrobacteraceae bacterium]
MRVDTVHLDLPALAGGFARRLHDAGLPVTAERAAAFARALTLTRPVSRRRLYWTARGVFVTERSQVRVFDRVFRDVFGSVVGGARAAPEAQADEVADTESAPADDRPPDLGSPPRPPNHDAPDFGLSSLASGEAGDDEEAPELPVPLSPSDEEVLREKQFDELTPGELARLNELMSRMHVAAPVRRTRRAERYRHGERIDLRRTLRDSLRTGGDPVHLRRRRRRIVPRRVVMLCDISGSMEPYARAYLQFLTCAARTGPNAEAFVFATRLTRVTRALASRNPARAIQNAAAAAPDWSSGTKIGDALKEWGDRHGRRGMARGAVVVILSDGWERGDPVLVAREMERLSRLAHRIVWVNPRASADEFVPRAGGMAAALPYVDALVSGHSFDALEQVIEAIAGEGRESPGMSAEPEAEEDEPWGSATPVPGSSVAMPSGYGPSRGKTTPGWSLT